MYRMLQTVEYEPEDDLLKDRIPESSLVMVTPKLVKPPSSGTVRPHPLNKVVNTWSYVGVVCTQCLLSRKY